MRHRNQDMPGGNTETSGPSAVSGAGPSRSVSSTLFFPLSRAGAALFILTGALGYFIGHPNPLQHVPVFALLSPFALYALAWHSPSGGTALLHGWLLGLVGHAAALYWVGLPIVEVGKLPLPLAIPCVLALSAYLALYPALFCLALRQLFTIFAARDDAEPTWAGRIIPPILGGLTWGGFEAASGVILTGFPWLSLSTAFVPWPSWIQAASLTGAYGLSGFLALIACLFAAAFLGDAKERLIMAIPFLWLVVSLPLFGAARLAPGGPASDNASPVFAIALAQGNVDQNQKWLPAFQRATIEKYVSLTEKALAEAKARDMEPILALWPETAMPFYYQADDVHGDTLRRFARTNNINLAFGTLGFRRAAAGGSAHFNRLQFIASNGRDLGFYDKEHLVPFGEYIPFSLHFEFLRNILQGSDFSPGTQKHALTLPLPAKMPGLLDDAVPPPLVNDKPQVVTGPQPVSPGNLALGILICYEVIFPELAQARVVQGADILLTVSNDAWFGRTSAPLQHLHLAAMRSVEQYRPMVRATNTGYSGAIDRFGRITDQGGLFEDEILLIQVAPASGRTLYHRMAPVPEVALMILAALALVCPWLASRRTSA